MTYKQIMIDNVDVSECEHVYASTSLFKEKTLVQCSAFFLENEDSCCNCSDNPNCYYKQLKRKENELEELRQYHNKCCQEFEKEKKDLIAKYNQLSTNFYNGDYCNTEHCSLLNAKEQECEELKKQNNQFDNGINEQFSKIIELEGRDNLLKQTLIEIKDIALGVCNYLNCPSPKDIRYEMDIILQKISDCEVENDR